MKQPQAESTSSYETLWRNFVKRLLLNRKLNVSGGFRLSLLRMLVCRWQQEVSSKSNFGGQD